MVTLSLLAHGFQLKYGEREIGRQQGQISHGIGAANRCPEAPSVTDEQIHSIGAAHDVLVTQNAGCHAYPRPSTVTQ